MYIEGLLPNMVGSLIYHSLPCLKIFPVQLILCVILGSLFLALPYATSLEVLAPSPQIKIFISVLIELAW